MAGSPWEAKRSATCSTAGVPLRISDSEPPSPVTTRIIADVLSPSFTHRFVVSVLFPPPWFSTASQKPIPRATTGQPTKPRISLSTCPSARARFATLWALIRRTGTAMGA